MAKFALKELWLEEGILILDCPDVDFDSFPPLGEELVDFLSALVIEKQQDADIHTWLIDFDGQRFFIKAEHYSAAVWIEALDRHSSQDELQFIARLMMRFC